MRHISEVKSGCVVRTITLADGIDANRTTAL